MFLEVYNYDGWYEEGDISVMPRLEGEEEVKKGKGIKILTKNKLLTRIPVLLAQINAGNKSFKLRNEIRQIIQSSHYNNGNAHLRQQRCNNKRT